MAKPYYLLLVRDDGKSPWRIEFGDYDRETVEYERQEFRESYQLGRVKASNLKILKSNTARQSCIDFIVRQANGLEP